MSAGRTQELLYPVFLVQGVSVKSYRNGYPINTHQQEVKNMSKSSGTVNSDLPRMIVREPTAANTTIPPLPVMPEGFQYGGEWMDPQWKKDLNGYKKLFKNFPIQMAAILLVTIGLAIGLASLSSTVCSGNGSGSGSTGDYEFTDDLQFEDDNDIFGGEIIDPEQPDGLLGTSVTGNVGETSVTILGYKFAEDLNGIDSIMVEYEVYNGSGDPTYFYYLDHKAFQNGVQLTNSYGKTDEYDNQEMILEILPGATHTVHCLYNLSNSTDPVEIRVSDMMRLSDDVVTHTFELSGDNAPAAMPEDVETPALPAIVSEGATGEFYIRFIDSSIVTDDWGDSYICASFDFTNKSENVTSAWASLTYYATQDGNDLSEDTFYFEEENRILMADVQPGETARIKLMFSGYDASGGNAVVSVCDYWDEESVISFSCPVN